jgi:CheY-like chemotaxis protein
MPYYRCDRLPIVQRGIMSQSTQLRHGASLLIVDQQNRLTTIINADQQTDCRITVYAAQTSAEAVALAQRLQPDLIFLDLGGQAADDVAGDCQILTRTVPLDRLIDAHQAPAVQLTDRQPKASDKDRSYTQLVRPFILAVRQVCGELVKTEPEMVHQLFRTWHQHTLERQVVALSDCPKVKVLVLLLCGCVNETPEQRAVRGAELARIFVSNQWRLVKSRLMAVYTSVRADLWQLLQPVTGRTVRGWRTVWH